jgi:biotin carboxylase
VVAVDPRERGKPVLVLGAGPAQLGLLATARERGFFVIAADRDPAAPGFRFADRRAIVSVEDEVGIERLAEAESVEGVIAPGIDWPVAIAARVAERLGLPHAIDAATGVLVTSKLKQRERFAAAGVPQPGYELCHSVRDAEEASARLGLPCVIKAPDRQGQRGLALVLAAEDVPAAAAAALDASRSGGCLVEQYAPGREVTVNAFSLDGRFHPLTVTDRRVSEPPAFGVALAHVWPSALPPAEIAACVDAARAAATALGITDGPTYTQVLATADGVGVVELAARLGGGHDAELCRAALGVDLNALALDAAVGAEVNEAALLPRNAAGGACVRFLVAPEGELVDVSGVQEAEATEGIAGVLVYRRAGHRFGPLLRGSDRAGAVLAVGDSRKQAVERARAAAAMIDFHVAEVAAPV